MSSRICALAAVLATLTAAASSRADEDVARWKGASQGTIVAALDMPAADMLRQSTKPMSKFEGGTSDHVLVVDRRRGRGMLHEHAEISQGTVVAAPGMAIAESESKAVR